MRAYWFWIGCFVSVLSHAATFPSGTYYDVCFSPAQNCEKKLVAQIERARKTILVQAYSFTSLSVARALIMAKERGVVVKVIMDKSQFDPQNYSMVNYLIHQGIPVWEDYQLNIAHNKVFILDERTVETGSYNYTVSAKRYNAENMIIIDNVSLAKKYENNWYSRQAKSIRVKG